MVKKIEDTFIRFDKMHERDRWTDRHADRQTDTAWRLKQRLYIIARQKVLLSSPSFFVNSRWCSIRTSRKNYWRYTSALSAVAACSQILLYLCVNFALFYGCSLVTLNVVSHNYKVNYDTLKTHHINSYIVNITLTHRYSCFTSRYYVSVME